MGQWTASPQPPQSARMKLDDESEGKARAGTHRCVPTVAWPPSGCATRIRPAASGRRVQGRGCRFRVECRYSFGIAGRQQCGAYPTLMAECRECEGQRPLDDVAWQAAVGHNGRTGSRKIASPPTGSSGCTHLHFGTSMPVTGWGRPSIGLQGTADIGRRPFAGSKS
jgi:hypothetical protein